MNKQMIRNWCCAVAAAGLFTTPCLAQGYNDGWEWDDADILDEEAWYGRDTDDRNAGGVFNDGYGQSYGGFNQAGRQSMGQGYGSYNDQGGLQSRELDMVYQRDPGYDYGPGFRQEAAYDTDVQIQRELRRTGLNQREIDQLRQSGYEPRQVEQTVRRSLQRRVDRQARQVRQRIQQIQGQSNAAQPNQQRSFRQQDQQWWGEPYQFSQPQDQQQNQRQRDSRRSRYQRNP